MKNPLYHVFTFLLLLCMAVTASAFSPDFYATESKLANGRWVKISVPSTGMYTISAAQLRQWGFSDPSKVRVYGYGGARIADELTEANYIDDLPQVQSVTTSTGIAFYGVGPEKWAKSQRGNWVNNSNIYSTVGYYFLSDTNDEARAIDKKGQGVTAPNADTTYIYRNQYEYDRVSPGEAGYLLVGESFKSQNNRKFSFEVPVDTFTLECGVVTNSSFESTIQFTVNGEVLPIEMNDRISVTAASTYQHGTYTLTSHQVATQPGTVNIVVNVKNAAQMKDCWLDYILINAKAPLVAPAKGQLSFSTAQKGARIANASEGLILWDVTNPLEITEMETAVNDKSELVWTNDTHGERQYCLWREGADLGKPEYVGVVANQNLHAMDNVDMVIFALPEFMAQGRRIADMHAQATEPLTVAVLNVNEVYNEFASGSPDVSALRKCLKMLYDRGNDSIPGVRYALIMGRSTYDNRHLTTQFDAANSHGTVPSWMGGERRNQLSDNSGYTTDDFTAMLEDGSGTSLGSDVLSVAIGRMPVRTVNEAKSAVDKLEQYVLQGRSGTWKNSFLFLADDGNESIHIKQTERMINAMLETPDAQNFISKVYVDAYDIIAGSCDGGRQDMYRQLDEGVVWWSFAGHANNHSWTGENMLNYNDINNLYLTHVPVLMAATCDFLRWDSNTLSGGEIFFHHRYGGTIATISATRPVYITDNGYFTRAIGRSINKRDEQGRMPRLGDIYRMAKNDIRNDANNLISNPNRLRYVLMGDPAMQLAMPHNIIRLDSIGGEAVTEESQVTLKALQRTVATGSVLSPSGELLTDFDGTIEVNIYDAERSITTKGRGDDNEKLTFEQHGGKLYTGSAPVVGGRFSLNIAMPGEVSHNFRPATMNMFASCNNSKREAVGINRDFYVFGLDETVPADTINPVIETMVLNHSGFSEGEAVNESPMVMAQIRDDVGINLSSAGVGHQMTLVLDDKYTYNDVSLYYTPSTDGSPSGTINYPLSDLTAGHHTLRLRVWDTNGNSANKEIVFNVQNGLAPKIFDIYCDANPAKTEAKFYIKHDRPDAMVSVTISVYNLLGRPVWEATVNGRSEQSLSAPVTWDLNDMSGRRVPRGIYLYRATISTDNGELYDTGSRKIGVAAQ